MSENKKLTRRDFLTLAGLAGVSVPMASIVGRVGASDILYSPEEYGGFLIRPREEGEPPTRLTIPSTSASISATKSSAA